MPCSRHPHAEWVYLYGNSTDSEQVLFFGSHCERLCMMQFALISLIPGLMRHLQDSADPAFNSAEENTVMPTSLKTSERSSCQFSIHLQ
jgi:hypothetical protein